MSMLLLWIVVCVVLGVVAETAAYTTRRRLEKDYDYDGLGESYYLKTYIDGQYRLVCWDAHYEDFPAREAEMSRWCEQFDLTIGSPYTGTDYPGEVTLHLTCGDDAVGPEECDADTDMRTVCDSHVRIQCMDPVSQFDKMQPLAWILISVTIALFVLCVISWICCCCIKCRANVKTTQTETAPQQQQQQQQYPQPPQQQYPQQQPGVYTQQPYHPQAQALYAHGTQPFQPPAPSAPTAVPPSYFTVTDTSASTKR